MCQCGFIKRGNKFCTSDPSCLLTGLAGFARLCPGDQYEVSVVSVWVLDLRGRSQLSLFCFFNFFLHFFILKEKFGPISSFGD